MRKLLAVALLFAATTAVAAEQKRVTIDVKDADVREILRSMQKQCGVKNLLIDRDVAGAGTLYLRDVPCETAFKVVFRSFRLAGVTYQNSVITVEKRR